MDYNFKEFTGVNARQENRISVTRSNSIGLPTAFFKNNKISDFKYAVLFYDEIKNAIGILFTNDDNKKNKFTILKHTSGFGGSLIAHSFFKNFNIDSKKYSGRYVWQKVSIENVGEIFVINLIENKTSIPNTVASSST